MSPNTKTLAMKARLANKLRCAFYKKNLEDVLTMSPEAKDTFLEELFNDVRAMHIELNNYKDKRKYRAAVEKERAARGFKRKRKTTLEQYKASLSVSVAG